MLGLLGRGKLEVLLLGIALLLDMGTFVYLGLRRKGLSSVCLGQYVCQPHLNSTV